MITEQSYTILIKVSSGEASNFHMAGSQFSFAFNKGDD